VRKRSGFGSSRKGDLQRHAEQAFRADEHADEIRPDVFEAVAAQLNHFAVGQHGFDAQHVIARHAILQAVHAARIEGDVAADGADRLAGRIGGIIQAVFGYGFAHVEIDHARLDDGDALLGIDVENVIQAIERDQQAIFDRQRAARQARAAAARKGTRKRWHRRTVRRPRFESREDDGAVAAVGRQRVGLVRREPGGRASNRSGG
jgi:hypothetical protein